MSAVSTVGAASAASAVSAVSAVSKAWRQVLAAEQSAEFGYSVLGPRLTPGPLVALARECQQSHTSAVAAIEAEPALATDPSPPAAPSYQLPVAVADDASAQLLAVRLEEATAAAWRYLLAVLAESTPDPSASAARAQALTALTDAAVRAVRWRAVSAPTSASVPFPGI